MFTPRGFFSEIPCPDQQKCMLPRCIFWHPEGQARASDVVNTAKTTQKHVNLKSGDDDDGQRKRRKVSSEMSDSMATPRIPLGEEQNGAVDQDIHADKIPQSKPSSTKQLSDKISKKILHSAAREISPPPLRRKVDCVKPLPLKQPIGVPKSETKDVSKVDLKTTVKAPLKKEALNPRMLKKPAPASHDVRYRLLKALYQQFERLNSELAKDAHDSEEALVLSDQELITKALDIEEDAAAVASIYSNVVKNKIMAYKRMAVPQWKEELIKEIALLKALETPLSDKPTIHSPTPIETGLSPKDELSLLPELYTPVEKLSMHGYVSSIPTNQDIETARSGLEASKGWEVCDRCKSRFQVFPGRREEDGALSSGGTCTYHFGKPFMPERSVMEPKAKREKRYRCCGQSVGDSSGCTQAESHVFKITEVKRLAAVLNFQKTPENINASREKPVCIDGEMGYTVYGLELIRLTATSWPSGKEIFDVLVRPLGEVLDLNSRYSGVWPKDMTDAVPWDATEQTESSSLITSTSESKRSLRIVESPEAARALLFTHISPETPIIGHGLENDLNAVRIIHPTLIDTALLFPHRAGLPYRNGLKMLMQTHLNREIQVVVDGKMIGHDSKEDANAAGDLVRFAIGRKWQKMQREGWTLQEGEFHPPLVKETASGASGTPIGSNASLTVEFLARDPAVVPQKMLGNGRKRSRAEVAAEDLEDGEVGD